MSTLTRWRLAWWRYAQGLANFAALAAANAAGGKLVPTDILKAMTQLKINRATPINGCYVLIISPQVAHDLLNSADWQSFVKTQYAEKIFKGEIGNIFGVRIVEATNPFIEGATEGTADPAAAKPIYSNIVLGQEAFGAVDMGQPGSSSPFKPSIIVNNAADKADPLNQYIVAGWKSFWASVVLNPKFAINVRSQAEFKAA